jgi:hypothetical protein
VPTRLPRKTDHPPLEQIVMPTHREQDILGRPTRGAPNRFTRTHGHQFHAIYVNNYANTVNIPPLNDRLPPPMLNGQGAVFQERPP